ncbi:MAG: ATP-binding protein [Acidobacteriota bacterium]|nr:ATP-binding protein [Acidobacteriota bacterium]
MLRLGAAFSLAAVAVLLAAGAWNLRLQRAHLTRLVQASAIERADDIRRSMREAMKRNRPGEVERIIEAIAAKPTVERIRLLDKRGRIRSSTDRTEIGAVVDMVAEQCVSCHREGEVLERPAQEDRARIFAGEDGVRLLAVIAPIRNEPSCASASCHAHPSTRTILGVLDVHLSLSETEAFLAASERQMMLGLVGTVAALSVLVGLLTWRMVLRPVGRLTAAAARVAAGELSAHIPVYAKDEIGAMTEAWNTMIAKLGRAQIVLERWSQTLEQKVQEKTIELETTHQRLLRVEKMASLGKLAAVVAHEINNPLTGISTYARLLKRKYFSPEASDPQPRPLDDEAERVLGLIEGEALRCSKIVRDLLLFSRSPDVSVTRQELEPLLQRCVMLLRHQAGAKRVELHVEVEDGLPSVTCDGSQIQQMTLALTLNAIEATPAEGKVTLRARHDRSTDEIVLEIQDTGRGIPAEHLDTIFEPFFTTKEEGSGVGLGLAVVYGIVERHHGTIEAVSEPDRGTLFTARLPLRRHQARPGAASADSKVD